MIEGRTEGATLLLAEPAELGTADPEPVVGDFTVPLGELLGEPDDDLLD